MQDSCQKKKKITHTKYLNANLQQYRKYVMWLNVMQAKSSSKQGSLSGPGPLQGLLMTPTCSLLVAISCRLFSLACLLASLRIFTRPTLSWVGLRVSLWHVRFFSILLSPSVWRCPSGWWLLQGYHGYLLPCCVSLGSTLGHQCQVYLLMMS